MQHPGLLRILAAIFYDLWLLFALLLLGAGIDTLIRHWLGNNANHLLLQGYFFLAPLLFFAWFWTHGGQTLGMRSWRIQVLTQAGEPISTQQAVLRYFAALLSWLTAGLGYLWVLLDHEQRSWHDRLSGTCLVMTQKRQKP